MHFLERKLQCLGYDFTKVCSQGPKWQWSNIDSDNGLVPKKWQAIIWTNDDPVSKQIYSSHSQDELTLVEAVNHAESILGSMNIYTLNLF